MARSGILIAAGLLAGVLTGVIVAAVPAGVDRVLPMLTQLDQQIGWKLEGTERDKNIADLDGVCRQSYRDDHQGAAPPAVIEHFCTCFALGATDDVTQLAWAAAYFSMRLRTSITERLQTPCLAALEAEQTAGVK